MVTLNTRKWVGFTAAIALLCFFSPVQAALIKEQYVETITLPKSFEADPNGYPVGLFWAVENVVSKNNGYDLTPVLGETVKVYRQDSRLVLKTLKGKIVGIIGSANSVNQIDHQNLEQWIEDHHTPFPSERLKMTPVETIYAFYGAIDHRNNALAWSYADPWYAYNSGPGLENGLPRRDGWQDNWTDGIKQIRLLSVKEIPHENPHLHYTVPTKFYAVKSFGQFQRMVYKSGVNTWVVEMVKPTEHSPWMFSGTPTGGY